MTPTPYGLEIPGAFIFLKMELNAMDRKNDLKTTPTTTSTRFITIGDDTLEYVPGLGYVMH